MAIYKGFNIDENNVIQDGFYKGCKIILGRYPKVGDFVAINGMEYTGFVVKSRPSTCIVIDLDDDNIMELLNLETPVVIPSEEYMNILLSSLNEYVNPIRNRYVCYLEYLEDVIKSIDSLKDSILPKLNIPVCSKCGKKSFRPFVYEGKCYCSQCFDEVFTYCSRCNEMVLRDSIEVCTDGNYLCPKCSKREFILPYHHYYPEVKFFGNNKKNTVPFMGIELEVDEGGYKDSSVREVVRIMNKDNNIFMYCSRDGSLEEGFEMITQPATLEYHYSIRDLYKSVFDRLLELEYLSHDTGTCGLHIHFNRNFYEGNEEKYISNLLYLVDKFWDEMVVFSRRNSRRLNRFAKKVDFDSIGGYIVDSNRKNRHSDHYYSINISNENTIEFRMFKGTLNIDTFFATLQFVYNCILCSKEKTVEEISKMSFEELITGRLCKKYWNRRKVLKNTEE